MSADVPFSESESIAGTPYRVIRLVGLGGMGSVYEVEHQELGKRFMLKALLGAFAEREEVVEHLRAEWRALGQLEHQNIVRVTDAGVSESGVPFYVMEFLVGETLFATLLREPVLPVDAALRVAHGVLEGLAAAHEIGIVHRDIKPANIFLTTRGYVKLLDFGIAKERDADLATFGGLSGTPRYMSPEQAAQKPLDQQTDLYSVGLVLFEMLAGRSPFQAENHMEWFDCHVDELPRPCSEFAPQVISPALDALIASLLEKDPALRPPSAHDVAERVAELMGTDPTLVDVDERLFERVRERAMLLGAETFGDAAESSVTSGEAVAAVRSAEFATPTALVVPAGPPEPRRRPEWWPLAVAGTLILGGAVLAALGSVALGWATHMDRISERERRDAMAAEAARREMASVVPPVASAPVAPALAPSASVAPGPAPSSSAATQRDVASRGGGTAKRTRAPRKVTPAPSARATPRKLPSAGLDGVVIAPRQLPSAGLDDPVVMPTTKKKVAALRP